MNITALVISAGGIAIAAGYGALYANVTGQVNDNTKDIATLQQSMASQIATISAIKDTVDDIKVDVKDIKKQTK